MYPVRQCTARLLYGVCVDVSRKGLLGAYMKSVPYFQHHVPWPTVRSREDHRGFQLSGCAGNRERTQATLWLSCLCIKPAAFLSHRSKAARLRLAIALPSRSRQTDGKIGCTGPYARAARLIRPDIQVHAQNTVMRSRKTPQGRA